MMLTDKRKGQGKEKMTILWAATWLFQRKCNLVPSHIFSLSISLSVSFISYFFSVHKLSWQYRYTNNSNGHKTML